MALWVLIPAIFVLVTLPMWALSKRLDRIARILARIEQMNLRSLKQQWNGGEESTTRHR
ncbi:MAG: hypothetical protein ACRD13_04305 [Terriglobales bacterium]